MPPQPTAFAFDSEAELLSALMHDARQPVQRLAEKTGSYRQKTDRVLKRLEGSTLWGYSAAVDYRRLGWNMYYIMAKTHGFTNETMDAMDDFVAGISSMEAVRKGHLRFLETHMLAGSANNWIVQVAARNRVEVDRMMQVFTEAFGGLLATPPDIMEVAYPLRHMGFVNPDLSDLRDFAEDVMLPRHADDEDGPVRIR